MQKTYANILFLTPVLCKPSVAYVCVAIFVTPLRHICNRKRIWYINNLKIRTLGGAAVKWKKRVRFWNPNLISKMQICTSWPVMLCFKYTSCVPPSSPHSWVAYNSFIYGYLKRFFVLHACAGWLGLHVQTYTPYKTYSEGGLCNEYH